MIRTHKIELKPNKSQLAHLNQSAGVSRFAYNWALAKWRDDYEAYKTKPFLCGKIAPSSVKYEGEIRKHLNSIKRENFPWMMDVSKYVPQQAIINLGRAFENFYSKRTKFPKFKQKGVRDSFEIGGDVVKVNGKYIKFPKVKPIKMKENLRFDGSIRTVVISRTAGKWFVSLSIEVDHKSIVTSKNHAIGIDVGIKSFVTMFDGKNYFSSKKLKPYKNLENKIKVFSRRLSKKQIKSNNRQKARVKLAKLHSRVANIRKDYLHKLTYGLTKDYSIIGIEDLCVKSMVKYRFLSKSILDASFFEFRRQLTYKAELYGSKIVVADRFFPSTKMCSCCGYKMEKINLSVRSWECPSCKTNHNRDENAANNLYKNAVSSTV